MMSLYDRISKCPQLHSVDYIYPCIPKADMMELMAPEVAVPMPTRLNGYVATEMIMIAKIGRSVLLVFGHFFGGLHMVNF